MERITLTVTPEQAGRTVESLLRRELSMAEGLVSSAKFRPDGILKNGVRVRVTERTAAGDVISVHIGDRGENGASPLALPLEILWEDDSLAVIDKPAGICVYGEGRPNVAGILASMWGTSIEFHPVNRLDVRTTGIMVAAKDGYAHDRLRRLLHTEDFRREYLAVAEGRFPEAEGAVELPISRRRDREGRRRPDPEGLPSRTEYRVLAEEGDRTLLLLRLCTGRTHQIRVHMAALGHPLAGDALYGAADRALQRPALHSWRLFLRHPLTGEALDIAAPPPADLRAVFPRLAALLPDGCREPGIFGKLSP